MATNSVSRKGAHEEGSLQYYLQSCWSFVIWLLAQGLDGDGPNLCAEGRTPTSGPKPVGSGTAGISWSLARGFRTGSEAMMPGHHDVPTRPDRRGEPPRMISTLLAGNPTLVRVLFVSAVVVSTLLGSLLHRFGRSGLLAILAALALLGPLALTLSPSSGSAAGSCTVQFSVPLQGIETLANVALMLPLALFGALRLGHPLRVLAAVSASSAFIEIVQALSPALGRACDTNDWLMNTVGAAVGALLATAIIAVGARRPERQRRTLP